MRRFTTILTLAFCIIMLMPYSLFSQEEKREKALPFNYSVSVSPLYILNRGLRFDVERRLYADRHWLQLGISGSYLPEKSSTYGSRDFWSLGSDQKINSLSNIGIELGYKYLFPSNKASYYVSGGFLYDYFDIRYDAYEYVRFEEDGLTYYERIYGEFPQYINRIGGNARIGIQTNPYSRFLVDGFVGVGYRYSFYSFDHRYLFDGSIFSIGHRGFTLTGGIRIGYRF